MKMFIYCNIRKKCLSIRPLEGPNKGHVVAHAEKILMRDASFRVSEAGRQRVLESGHKNVHAGVVGEIEAIWGAEIRLDDISNKTIKALGIGGVWSPISGTQEIRYNPRLAPTFVRRADGFVEHLLPVHHAARVELDRCSMRATGVA